MRASSIKILSPAKNSWFDWFRMLLLACLFTTGLGLTHAAESSAPTTSTALDQKTALQLSQSVVGTIPGDYTFQDREGRIVRLSQFRGKPLLVSFIYTGCFQVCPLTTRSLQTAIEAGRDVFGTSQFNVVSIGFNQPADSPQSLKSFAKQYRIDVSNWEFLSPSGSVVERLAQEFGFSYLLTPAGFDHILQVSLLDANGRIYQQIYGDELTADSIGEPLKQVIANVPGAPRPAIDDLMDRVRILCTVYDPKTGKYEVKYGLFIEVAGGVTFALTMLWFFLSEWLTRRRLRRRMFSSSKKFLE
jgi:protein SCO1/2